MKKITIYTLLWVLCISAINTSAQNNQATINNVQSGDIFYHTVERGQTVYSIAKMYNVKVEDIYKLNIGSNDAIKAGEVLKIPQKKAVTKKEASPDSGPKSGSDDEFIFHTIQTGDTPYGLSRKYNVQGEDLFKANPGLSESTFYAGKTIRIPTGVKKNQSTEIVDSRGGGKEIHYTVPAGETKYNICRTFKTSEKELLKLNPELAGGLRTGMVLRIPLRINERDLPKEAEQDANEVNAMLKAKKEVKLVNAVKVALLLPLDTKNPNPTDFEKNIIEYYEGMALAIDTLRRQDNFKEMEFFAYEIGEKGAQGVKKVLQENGNILKNVDLIIGGGVSDEQIKLIADFAKANKIKYIVPISRNDEVLDNAYIFQVNAQMTYLCANAAYAGANLFGKYNIIFLDTEDDSKQYVIDFVKEFKQELRYRNISYKEATYNVDNFEDYIQSQLSTTKPNVIIPTSESLDALNKIRTVLRSVAETKPEYRLSLFGYPDWQTKKYTKECLEDFHILNTYIFSHFFADNVNPNVVRFYDRYRNWYSKTPPMAFPRYSMLGYDTGMFFLSAIRDIGVNFENNLSEVTYKSLQTGFNFERVNNWGGFINTNIYIIHYGNDFTITRSDFK